MVCLYCGGKTSVINSRLQKRQNQTWRRRECLACHAVFTTEETVDLYASVRVRLPDGTLQPFNRDKLFSSIMRACGHRREAISDAGALTATTIAAVLKAAHSAVIEAAVIAHAAYQALHQFDKAAAVQYRAYHPVKPA
jgi:transcriptional regulator NrdR family protein